MGFLLEEEHHDASHMLQFYCFSRHGQYDVTKCGYYWSVYDDIIRYNRGIWQTFSLIFIYSNHSETNWSATVGGPRGRGGEDPLHAY